MYVTCWKNEDKYCFLIPLASLLKNRTKLYNINCVKSYKKFKIFQNLAFYKYSFQLASFKLYSKPRNGYLLFLVQNYIRLGFLLQMLTTFYKIKHQFSFISCLFDYTNLTTKLFNALTDNINAVLNWTLSKLRSQNSVCFQNRTIFIVHKWDLNRKQSI